MERGRKTLFVLGVYASAVHARWVDDNGSLIVNALAVASEPEIFWRGDGAAEIISRVTVPHGAGRLVPASRMLNGPSGVTLDDAFLSPLLRPQGVGREETWLCHLLPESRSNGLPRNMVLTAIWLTTVRLSETTGGFTTSRLADIIHCCSRSYTRARRGDLEATHPSGAFCMHTGHGRLQNHCSIRFQQKSDFDLTHFIRRPNLMH